MSIISLDFHPFMSEGTRGKSLNAEADMEISPKAVRYIKLGKRGIWEEVSLSQGEIHLGHARVPDELARSGNRDAIKLHVIGLGRSPQTAADDAREVLDFYLLGADCLWVTLASEHLWWAFASPDVVWLGEGKGHGARMRRTIGGWSNRDLKGQPLRTDSLSSSLTKVAGYHRTICAVEASDYLLRRINGEVDPIAAKNAVARESMLAAITEAIAVLDWKDFETLVDAIFARSGWHRVSQLGGDQKLFDMVFEQPTTGERTAVQVKSSATQAQLDRFIEDADRGGLYDRLFFVTHKPRGRLAAPDQRRDVHVWAGRELAETTLRVGLADWVTEKIT